jgi:GH25 family lysozyme M1 (1,4-beta-N-acetylmuramidase)
VRRETADAVRVLGVMGPDVAVDQGPVDWRRVRGAGARFAFARATAEGGARDLRFTPARWTAIRAAGLARGAYHHARPGATEPADEARAFGEAVRRAGGLEPGDLPPALAVLDSDLSAAETLAWIGDAVAGIESATGSTPLLLTSPGFWIDRLGDPRVSFGCDLWIADPSGPRMPRAWSDWALWRYTVHGRVRGVGPPCGLSRVNASYPQGVFDTIDT